MVFRTAAPPLAAARATLVFLVFLVVRPLPVEGESFGRFPCTQTANCSCGTSGPEYYEFQCPPSTYPSVFDYRIIPGHAHLHCSSVVHPSNYSYLPKLPMTEVGNKIFSFNFMGCPLPDGPLSDVIVQLGSTKNLGSLLFQSNGRNLSNTLKKFHFIGLESVSRLVLSGNSLTNIPEDVFADMKNLTWLNLRSNRIRLHAGIFKPISHLVFLELGSNDLQFIPQGLFKHSTHLKQLNLWKNKLNNLTGSIFEGLDNVEELDLSENQMQNVHSDLFFYLPKLTTLNLDFNNFSSFPDSLFVNNPKMKIFKLSNNYGKINQLPEKFLSNLTELEEVYCESSNIESVSESLFWESIDIKNISLARNLLTTIPKDLFRDQVNMLNLDLKSNKIAHLHSDTFQTLTNLKVLNLDYNNIKVLPGRVFQSTTSLLVLKLSHNNMEEIAYNVFDKKSVLETLDLSYNNLSLIESIPEPRLMISDVGIHSQFRSLLSIKVLNLRNNKISRIFDDWRILLLKLEKLDLSFNSLDSIHFVDLDFLSRTAMIDLRNNKITHVDFSEAENIARQKSPNDAVHTYSTPPITVKALIDNNPIDCTCGLYHFLTYLKGDIDPQVQSLVTVETGNTTCHSPPNLVGRPINSLEYPEMLCLYDPPDSKISECPKNCICFVRFHDKHFLVYCSTKNMTLPLQLPSHPLYSHMELHFENSSLSNMKGLNIENDVFNKINILYISNNNITTLTPDDIPHDIEILDLRDNHISHFAPSVFAKFNTSYFKYIYLSGNPISCDCDNHPFLSFIQTNYIQVKDMKYLKCSDGELVSTIKVSKLCGPNTLVIALTVTIAITAFIISLMAALYYKYQQNIKVWLFARGWCLWWITEKEVDRDKIYDAFISFSYKDEDFVVNKLVPVLENGPHPFKICIHFRDWTVGEWIPTQIAKSVQDSRRTVVVLSPNFLDSIWGRLEFRAAHSRALKEGRARVIVILYGDIGPTDNLDPELQAYLSMNTYVKWGDPWFWDKLRYALPHPSQEKQLAPTQCITNKKGFDDRLELIHPSTPGTPPGQNTPPAHQAHTNPLMNHVNSIPNGTKPASLMNGTITMNGKRINGSAKHSDV